MNKTIAFIVVFAGLLSLTPSTGQAADSAEDILAATGLNGGLIVHLGCGDGKLTGALFAKGSFLIRGLDADAAIVSEARQHIHELGFYGKVSIDRFDGRRLPYVDNLVNLLVADELGDVAMDEVIPTSNTPTDVRQSFPVIKSNIAGACNRRDVVSRGKYMLHAMKSYAQESGDTAGRKELRGSGLHEQLSFPRRHYASGKSYLSTKKIPKPLYFQGETLVSCPWTAKTCPWTNAGRVVIGGVWLNCHCRYWAFSFRSSACRSATNSSIASLAAISSVSCSSLGLGGCSFTQRS